MSSVAFRPGTDWRGGMHSALTGLRGYNWRFAGVATLVGAVIFLVNLPGMIEQLNKYGWHTGAFMVSAVAPIIGANVAMLGWLIADAGTRWPRTHRLVASALAASAIAATLIVLLWIAVGGEGHMAAVAAQRNKAPPPLSLMLVSDFLLTLTYSGLFFTVLELVRRRKRTQGEFQQVMLRQTSVAQQVLQSRLAAMQAQVEPRFLFDSLVDIEALYAKDPQAAAELLDRLIVYLRAALPKLRGDGSTIAAELELVQAYVSVSNALHDGRPHLTVTLADGCANERFYPMLLLPLIQRAVRGSAEAPPSIRIGASRAGSDIAIVIRIAAAGGCVDETELARVRERLSGLFGGAASLECTDLTQQTTQLTLRFPAAAQAQRSPERVALAT